MHDHHQRRQGNVTQQPNYERKQQRRPCSSLPITPIPGPSAGLNPTTRALTHCTSPKSPFSQFLTLPLLLACGAQPVPSWPRSFPKDYKRTPSDPPTGTHQVPVVCHPQLTSATVENPGEAVNNAAMEQDQQAAAAANAAAQQAMASYPQMTMGQFQTLAGNLAMSQLLQAATQHTETLDGLKAAIQGNPALPPDPKRQKVEGDQTGAPPELGAPVQLLGLPTHPIITSLALPIGSQLQLNGALLQQQHEQDDSGEDGTQDDGDGKGGDDRANATKEKNRKAQQRFRQRQKEKMQRLETEVETLRKMLGEKGAADPNSLLKAEQGPSVDEMYEHLEQMLDQCPEVHSLTAITFLQSWLNKMPDDARRLHYKAVKKRFDSGLKEDVKMWVQQALQP